MNHQVEQLGGSMVKLTLEISPEQFESAIERVYQKTKKQITLPGFRKGKAPRKLVERVYGKEVFYEDAINEVLPDMYDEAVKEEGLEVMSRPAVNVDMIEAGKPVQVTCEVAVKPEVTLGKYKGLKVDKADLTVTDEEVEEEVKRAAERNARLVEVTDRPSEMGDTVTIDYEGFQDGVAFEGGKGTDHNLKLGSHTFIDTFEDQLVGKKAGDECEVNVTFPEQYHQKDLAGKPAVFKVTVKKVQYNELPEINDEFAQEVSEFNTLEEYKADTKKTLTERKERQIKESRRASLISSIVEKSTMDMPEPMVAEECDRMINNFAQTLRYQGMDIQRYMEMTNSTLESMRQSVRPEAERQLKESLVLEAIAKAENLEVTEEDVTAELETMAKTYGMEADKLREAMSEGELEGLQSQLKVQKAMDFVLENAKESAPKAAAKTTKTTKAKAEEGEETAKKPAKKTTKKTAETSAEKTAEASAEKPAAKPRTRKTTTKKEEKE